MTDARDPLPPVDPGLPPGTDEATEDTGGGLLDKMRGTGVGVEDPNIVGDVGPTDVAPGADPDDPPAAPL
jgi:hypothetical protein